MPFIKSLKKKYEDDFHIEVFDWQFPDDQITLLNGPSGSGKSTIIRLLLGLEHPDECEWSIRGHAIQDMLTPDRNFSVVFQNYDLFPHMSALENIHFFANCRKIKNETYEKDLKELVEILKMGNFLNRLPNKLSGGERQRVALSRALISRPQMLFLDEPFSALDVENRENARELLAQIIEIRKIPCLLVSHDQDDKKRWQNSSFSIVGEAIKSIKSDNLLAG